MKPPHSPRSVLLTGATGSLGGQLCAELLAASVADVHCLVRATDAAQARVRLTRRLARLDDPPQDLGHRLTAVPGDMQQPRLGLTPAAFDALAESIDTILHCAAQVDLAAGYDELAPANLGAVTQLINLARRRAELTGRLPAVHHVSTMAVFMAARSAGIEEVVETTPVTTATSGPLGYPRTKAAAEIAWRAAASEHGLPLTIYRPALITGHSRTGRTSSSDLLTPILWAYTAIGAVPRDIPLPPGERVDVVARALVRLMHHPGAPGQAYHLLGPEPPSIDDVLAVLERAGHHLDRVPVDEWWRRLERHRDDPSVAPLTAMTEMARYLVPADDAHQLAQVDVGATWAALAECGIRPEPLDAPFLDRLVSGLTLPPPLPTRRIPSPPPETPPLRIDGMLSAPRFGHGGTFPDTAALAASCESAGYGNFWAQEQNHDALISLAAAATATTKIGLGSAVVVALARSPMTIAYAANDLHFLSQGRFVLGIGPQFRANLVYRYGVPGDRPLARLREYVAALRAIWAHWNEGRPLAFRGEFYTHALTNPYFTPPPNPYGTPQIMLAATGPRAAELAGEIADGLIAPPFTNRDHFAEILLPAAERGLSRAGRTREDFTVSLTPLLAVKPEDTEHTRLVLALWCGTRVYRPIFERYGLGELADILAELSLSEGPDRWQRMADHIDDDVLNLFATGAAPGQHGAELRARYGGIVDRIALPAPSYLDGRYAPSALGLSAADPRLLAPTTTDRSAR